MLHLARSPLEEHVKSKFRQLQKRLVIASAVLQRMNTNILGQSSESDSESFAHAWSALSGHCADSPGQTLGIM